MLKPSVIFSLLGHLAVGYDGSTVATQANWITLSDIQGYSVACGGNLSACSATMTTPEQFIRCADALPQTCRISATVTLRTTDVCFVQSTSPPTTPSELNVDFTSILNTYFGQRFFAEEAAASWIELGVEGVLLTVASCQVRFGFDNERLCQVPESDFWNNQPTYNLQSETTSQGTSYVKLPLPDPPSHSRALIRLAVTSDALVNPCIFAEDPYTPLVGYGVFQTHTQIGTGYGEEPTGSGASSTLTFSVLTGAIVLALFALQD